MLHPEYREGSRDRNDGRRRPRIQRTPPGRGQWSAESIFSCLPLTLAYGFQPDASCFKRYAVSQLEPLARYFEIAALRRDKRDVNSFTVITAPSIAQLRCSSRTGSLAGRTSERRIASAVTNARIFDQLLAWRRTASVQEYRPHYQPDIRHVMPTSLCTCLNRSGQLRQAVPVGPLRSCRTR